MKVARMHHSMIYIEEKDLVLAVGGEDENGNLLDSCESFNVKDKLWKMLNTLN
jgi:N-acetylneuraminic acid mutarotase